MLKCEPICFIIYNKQRNFSTVNFKFIINNLRIDVIAEQKDKTGRKKQKQEYLVL